MKTIKVLPIAPNSKPSFWGFNSAVRMMGKKAAMTPTSLATVAAMFPEQFEIEPIMDLNVCPEIDMDRVSKADLIITGGMIVHKDSLEHITQTSHSLGKKVLMGGPYVTSYTSRAPKADYLVLGEAELSLKPFIDDFLEGRAQKLYSESDGLKRYYIPVTSRGKPLLINTPIPRWDLIDLSKYVTAIIQYSRGCPHGCEFCDILSLYGPETRTKITPQMINEFDALFRRGWRGSPVFVADDNFIGRMKEVRELLPQVKDWQKTRGYPFNLFTETSILLADNRFEDVLRGMVEAGFDETFIGLESPDPEVLAGFGKSQNKTNLLDAVKTIQRAGLRVMGGFIIGSDNDKRSVFENTYNFVQEAGIPIPMVGLLSALEGTQLYTRLKAEGRLREDSNGNNTHNYGFNFIPRLDEQFLIQGYRGLLERLFDSKNYFDRCRTQNSRLGPHQIQSRYNLSGIRAAASILSEKLFFNHDSEVLDYLDEALNERRPLGEAFADAIKLHHFQEMMRSGN